MDAKDKDGNPIRSGYAGSDPELTKENLVRIVLCFGFSASGCHLSAVTDKSSFAYTVGIWDEAESAHRTDRVSFAHLIRSFAHQTTSLTGTYLPTYS